MHSIERKHHKKVCSVAFIWMAFIHRLKSSNHPLRRRNGQRHRKWTEEKSLSFVWIPCHSWRFHPRLTSLIARTNFNLSVKNRIPGKYCNKGLFLSRLSISVLIWKKVPIENCRVFSQIRPKGGTFNSHGPANSTKPTEVTQFLRRRGDKRGGEEKEARFALQVFILATFFGREKTTWNKAFCGGHVFANTVRYIFGILSSDS